MRADLQRYFGLNLDRLGVEFGAFHCAECIANLPLGASLLREIDPRFGWTNQEHMLHGIMCGLAGKEIPYPWDKSGGIDGLDTQGLPLDEFRDWYENNNWKEVEGWQVR